MNDKKARSKSKPSKKTTTPLIKPKQKSTSTIKKKNESHSKVHKDLLSPKTIEYSKSKSKN
jgi:hypothetical protein